MGQNPAIRTRRNFVKYSRCGPIPVGIEIMDQIGYLARRNRQLHGSSPVSCVVGQFLYSLGSVMADSFPDASLKEELDRFNEFMLLPSSFSRTENSVSRKAG